LQKAANLNPTNPEPPYLLGQSFFRMGRYEEALKRFKKALELDRRYYSALHRSWAVRLEMGGNSQEIKDKIRAEIEEMISEKGNVPDILFTAYKGYQYINDRVKRVELIKRLAQMANDDVPKESVAANLLEEIIGEKDTKRRIELAEIYLQNFPNARGGWTATWKLFSDVAGIKDDKEFLLYAESYLNEIKDNQALNYSVSFWLVKKGIDLEKAKALLERNLNLLKDPSLNKIPEHFLLEEWEKTIKRRKALNYSLLGWVLFKQGKRLEARNYLEQAQRFYDLNDLIHYRLGRILSEEVDKNGAILSLKRSLEIDDKLEKAETLLKRLLQEEYGYKGNAAQFFADKEDVVTFTDITIKAGLGDIKAAKVAWGDYNNDGFEDLLLDGPRLFKNLGGGVFEEVTEDTGMGALKRFNGGIWGDFNNDGFLDIYLMSSKKDLLLKNSGNGGFKNVTMEAFGLMPSESTEAAAWGDFNNDGLLDLYVAVMERKGSELGICSKDRLWRNEDDGTFKDITEEAGIKSDEGMCGRGVVWGDFNNDGFSDIMVSNYRLDPNFLWKNNGDSTFVEVAEEKRIQGEEVEGAYGHTIGSVFGDIDNDGDLDLFSANLAHSRYIEFSDKSMLLINSNGKSFKFSKTFEISGITYAETHSDPSFGDVDNDGDLDLYITSVYPGENSFLYLNNGSGTFRDVSWLSGTRVKNGWGSAFADIDNDGDLDLAVASREGIHLFSNNGNDNHYLTVKFRSSSCNSFGIGSRVKISYKDKEQIREVRTGKGTGTEDSIPVEFGLGRYNGMVDIEVQTGCGYIIKTRVISPDRIITLTDRIKMKKAVNEPKSTAYFNTG
ncbi:MAG: FG-GAP-like repeat-containing protein, partial [Thermodesulfobacteriota bacterium]